MMQLHCNGTRGKIVLKIGQASRAGWFGGSGGLGGASAAAAERLCSWTVSRYIRALARVYI